MSLHFILTFSELKNTDTAVFHLSKLPQSDKWVNLHAVELCKDENDKQELKPLQNCALSLK